MKNKDKYSHLFKKPTLYQMFIGVVICIIKDKFTKKKPVAPQYIGQYRLIKEIKKKNPFVRFSTGIYSNKKQKVFIKTWQGVFKDIGYYAIINEYLICKILQRKINGNKELRLRTPKLIGTRKSHNSLSIIYEYIKGRNLEKYNHINREKIILEVISGLRNISYRLSLEEKEVFSGRSNLFYVFSLPIIVFIALLCNFKKYKIIFESFLETVKLLPKIEHRDIVISHRDLNPENIIISDSCVYILDFDKAVLTNDLYDPSYLLVKNKNHHAKKLFSQPNKKDGITFFIRYIIFHLLADPSNPASYRKRYIDMLETLYA